MQSLIFSIVRNDCVTRSAKMNNTKLVKKTLELFPYVDRPSDELMTIHGPTCSHCNFLLEQLEDFREQQVSKVGSRVFIGELSLLSQQGYRWMLPSYLLSILSEDPDEELAEYFIYSFSIKTKGNEIQDSDRQTELFKEKELNFLIEVIEFTRTYMAPIYYEDLDKAIIEINRVINKIA